MPPENPGTCDDSRVRTVTVRLPPTSMCDFRCTLVLLKSVSSPDEVPSLVVVTGDSPPKTRYWTSVSCKVLHPWGARFWDSSPSSMT